jgi:surface protein
MFLSNGSFNQDLSKWNVGSVTSMEAMFYNADAFTNGSNTNTNPVTGLTGINGWNINTSPAASVTMLNMFATNNAFNQPIGSWNVSSVTNMSGMFFGATAFNNGLAVGLPGTLTWNTVGVTTMSQMFEGAVAFNCNVGGFNVSACSNFLFMFRSCSTFNNGNNASIGNWILKTTGSIPMNNMFQNALVFNQPIGSWNVSRVSNMQLMFSNSAFNQNIGSWNVSNVTNFTDFMNTKTSGNFSTANLDAIYNGWIVNGVKPNISSPLTTNISFGTAKYTAAGTPGKNILIGAPNNWIIQDGGI